MNFHKHYKDIKKLMLRDEKRKSGNPNKPDQQQFYKGNYVISRDPEIDKNQKLQYKIGMAHGAGGIYRRMDGYKMGWGYIDEFFVHFYIICPKSSDARLLETKILAKGNMEEVKNPRNTLQDTEFRIVAKKEILHNSLLKALRDNPKLWDFIVVFGESGWKIIKNDGADKINSGALSKPADDMSKKPMLYSDVDNFVEEDRKQLSRDTSKIIDVKRKMAVDINTIKKGDLIRDKWGYAMVKSVSKKKYYIDVESEHYSEGYRLYLH